MPPAGGGWLWGGAAAHNPPPPSPLLNDWQDRDSDLDNANVPQQPTVEVSEEQVCMTSCFGLQDLTSWQPREGVVIGKI